MKKSRVTKEDRVFDIISIIVMVIVMIVTLYPLYFIVIASISNPTLVNSGRIWLYPKEITFIGIKRLIGDGKIWLGYRNTIFITAVGVAINLFVTLPAAYALSRKDFRCRKFVLILFTITMFFSGGMIPTYLVVKNTHLLNSYAALFIPTAFSVWNLIVARTFFMGIPFELTEAAAIDGCSNFRLFFTIILPLSKAMIAVVGLYYMVGHWNGYFDAMIYLSDANKYPLQLYLREILIEATSMAVAKEGDQQEIQALIELANQIKYAAVIVSCLPLLIIYPFLQKYFAKGALIGSIKG